MGYGHHWWWTTIAHRKSADPKFDVNLMAQHCRIVDKLTKREWIPRNCANDPRGGANEPFNSESRMEKLCAD